MEKLGLHANARYIPPPLRNVHADSKWECYNAIIKQYDVPVSTIRNTTNKQKCFTTVRILSGYCRKHKVSSKLA